ncbi:MAG: IclR family transcriptional regulator [Rudaea sp.]|uniref:IclR family transcriptional regulator n=1 Tax=unclassified Rudaea TaxID=2627037 RepID=UPI0010F62DB4|nr:MULTISPECIES: IclR family transcriptional regulator [unclassified Rudaea]MBN8887479.1 IclR family transcriptional regulator [Rudaea sp.]
MTKATKYRAPALDKGLDILELLARTSGSLNMTEIAQGVGYSKSEIFRMLQVLETRGYLARDENDSSYTLTNRLFLLGMERPPIKDLSRAALPVMHRLADQIQNACHLVVPSQEQIVVIARVDAPSDLGFVVRVGHRRPFAHSTSGLVLFAFQSEETQERLLAMMEAGEDRFKRKQFLANATLIREQGYANLRSEAVDAVIDLSAPILQRGHAVGTLTIPFVERHPVSVPIKSAIQHLRDAADEISSALLA